MHLLHRLATTHLKSASGADNYRRRCCCCRGFFSCRVSNSLSTRGALTCVDERCLTRCPHHSAPMRRRCLTCGDLADGSYRPQHVPAQLSADRRGYGSQASPLTWVGTETVSCAAIGETDFAHSWNRIREPRVRMLNRTSRWLGRHGDDIGEIPCGAVQLATFARRYLNLCHRECRIFHQMNQRPRFSGTPADPSKRASFSLSRRAPMYLDSTLFADNSCRSVLYVLATVSNHGASRLIRDRRRRRRLIGPLPRRGPYGDE
jgi:hypothetical protein